MENPTSGCTWNKTRFISMEGWRKQTFPASYAYVQSIESTKTTMGKVHLKTEYSFNKIQHPWHHSIDRKHVFARVKFEAGLSNLLARKLELKKKLSF